MCFYLKCSYFYRRIVKYFFIFFFKNVMFYDFIYLAKGFRMRPKVRSTLNDLDHAWKVYLEAAILNTLDYKNLTWV